MDSTTDERMHQSSALPSALRVPGRMICPNCRFDADWQSAVIEAKKSHPLVLEVDVTGQGHDVCTGCDCAHYPVGTGQIKEK